MAGLKKQNISLPITGGTDEGTHKWVVPEGKLTECTNVEFDKAGAATRRSGFSRILVQYLSSASVRGPATLHRYRDELLFRNEGELFSFLSTESRVRRCTSLAPTCVVSSTPVGTQRMVSTSPRVEGAAFSTAVTSNGYMGVVRSGFDARTAGGINVVDVQVIDLASGNVVRSDVLTDSAFNYSFPKIVAIGDRLIVTHTKFVAPDFQLHGYSMQCNTTGLAAGWGAPVALVVVAGQDIGKYDLAVDSSYLYIIAHDSGGGNDLNLRRYNSDLTGAVSGAEASGCNPAGLANVHGVSIDATSGDTRITIAWLRVAAGVYEALGAVWQVTGAGAWARVFGPSVVDTGAAAGQYYAYDANGRQAISCLAYWNNTYKFAISTMYTTAGGSIIGLTVYRDYSNVFASTGTFLQPNVFQCGPMFQALVSGNYDICQMAVGYDKYSAISWDPGGGTPWVPYGWAGSTPEEWSYASFLLKLPTSFTTIQRALPMAFLEVGRGVYPVANYTHHLAAVAKESGSLVKAYAAVPYIKEVARIGGVTPFEDSVWGFSVVAFDFSDQSRLTSVDVGGYAVFGAGSVCHYDGEHHVEAAFPWAPKIMTAATSNTGASVPTGPLYYKGVYEAYDRNGNRVLSSTSLPPIGQRQNRSSAAATGTTDDIYGASGGGGFFIINDQAGHDQVDIDVLAPSLSKWLTISPDASVGVSLYRYVPEDGQYHLVDRKEYGGTGAVASFLEWVSFTDTYADATLLPNESLYTEGGALDNDIPPGGRIVAFHRGRVWVVSDEYPDTVYYSKQLIDGRAPEYSLALYIRIADGHGDITGLASMDNVLLLFKERRIYAVSGEGPGTSGLPADGFSQPQVISNSVGCTQYRSVVTTPEGVFFLSERGVYLIDRGLSVQFVGAEFEDSFQETPYCYGAICLREKSIVRWLVGAYEAPQVSSSSSAHSRMLDFNYEIGAWTKTITGYSQNSTNHRIPSIVEWNDNTYLTYDTGSSTSYILYQDPAAYADELYSNFKTSVWWAWLKLGNLQDFKRIWRTRVLTETLDKPSLEKESAGVKIYHRYDYDDETTDTYTWTQADVFAFRMNSTDADPLETGQPEQFEVHCKKQKVQSMRVGFEIYDCKYGAGLRIVGLDFEVGLKKGGFKNLHAGRRT